MKTMRLSFIALAAMAAASIASAASPNLADYYSAQHPALNSKVKAVTFPATDITVINASTSPIYAIVPNSPIYDLIYPTANDHIRNNTFYGDTNLVLQDTYQNTIFNRYVCRASVVTVYGQPGSNSIVIDTEYCS